MILVSSAIDTLSVLSRRKPRIIDFENVLRKSCIQHSLLKTMSNEDIIICHPDNINVVDFILDGYGLQGIKVLTEEELDYDIRKSMILKNSSLNKKLYIR